MTKHRGNAHLPYPAASARSAAHYADASGLALVFFDQDMQIVFANAACAKLFGYKPTTMIGLNAEMLTPVSLRTAYRAEMGRLTSRMASGPSRSRTIEMTALHADGSEFPVEILLSASTTNDGVKFGGAIRDISFRRRRVNATARRDALTGLPNRLAVTDLIEALIQAQRPATVAVIGLDGLKKINDDLGYRTGDSVLKSLAIRLPAIASENAVLARVDGSMFALLLPNVADAHHASSVAARLLETINQPLSVGEHTVKLSACAGLAIAPPHGDAPDELLSAAELALQRCNKSEGHIKLFEPAMRAAAAEAAAMNSEIVHAFEGMELELHFQPQLDIANGAVLGAEALLRWNHSARGVLAPAAFLGALESHSLAPQIGDWILDEACRHVALWRRTGVPAARVTVNLFAGQLRAGTLVEITEATLRRHGLPGDSLEFDISEVTLLEGGANVERQLYALRKLGVRLAIDNFGSSHAALSLVKRFPVTTLKVDRTLIGSMLRDRVSGAIVASLINVAKSLKIDVMAQGIETARQEEKLIELGCRLGQGYRFAKPLAPKRFQQFCARRRVALAA